jgi:hypothetical protein
MVGSFSSPNKTEKARAAAHLRFAQNPRKKKERFGCGMQFSEGRSRIFLLDGGLVAVSHANPKSNPAVANKRSAKGGLCKMAPAKHTSTFL